MTARLPGMGSLVLTDRQQRALAIVTEHGPLSSEELGRREREARGRSDSGQKWDSSNGRSVAEVLASLGFCRRVKVDGRMLWALSEWTPGVPEGAYDPRTSEMPL